MAQEQKKHPESGDGPKQHPEHHEDLTLAEAAAHDVEPGPLPEDPLEDDPVALRAEVAELKDRLLRALAEAENVRKRADRDRRDAEAYGITRFARDILSVHDNFERAMRAVTDEARAAAGPLIEGIELTQKELVAALGKHGIRRIEPRKGERFDPKLHQAMFEAPLPGTTAGEIIEVMSEGFTIGERLLRPAQVGVSAGGPPPVRPPSPPPVPKPAAAPPMEPDTPDPSGDAPRSGDGG
jgi:molecular chaperone GrpE